MKLKLKKGTRDLGYGTCIVLIPCSYFLVPSVKRNYFFSMIFLMSNGSISSWMYL